MLDNLDQPVNPHPDFFIPLDLRIPQVDLDTLNNGIISNLAQQHKGSNRLWFNSAITSGDPLLATQKVANDFLNPIGLRAGVMGIFIVNPNTYDKNIHCDAGKMETRLNFYELTISEGIVRWFPDTNDGFNDYTKNLDGVEIIDYTWPWVLDLKKGKIGWKDVPNPIWSSSTNCPSALVRTNLPHHVIQGNGLRVTVTCQVVDIETELVTDTWKKIPVDLKTQCCYTK
jgi:hypothetical protein